MMLKRTNSPVEKPIGSRSHGQRLRADLEREYLTRDDPSARAPRGSKEIDVEAHEGNECFLAGRIARADNSANDCDYKLANAHADGSRK